MLKNDDGIIITEHHDMASLLWRSYKERMGHSEGMDMQFDLATLLNRVEGLDELTIPFEKKEMDDVIKEMPADRAPGPDDFNGLFVKRCWPIVQNEFYRLAQEFHAGTLNLQNINGSYITLVPKKVVPEGVNDYRPISLTNVCLKFLTKLATREDSAMYP
jgi:hypothetical protein